MLCCFPSKSIQRMTVASVHMTRKIIKFNFQKFFIRFFHRIIMWNLKRQTLNTLIFFFFCKFYIIFCSQRKIPNKILHIKLTQFQNNSKLKPNFPYFNILKVGSETLTAPNFELTVWQNIQANSTLFFSCTVVVMREENFGNNIFRYSKSFRLNKFETNAKCSKCKHIFVIIIIK